MSQFRTKNKKFIQALKETPQSGRTHITYWCPSTHVSSGGSANQAFIGRKIDITSIETGKILATGTVVDATIDTVEDLYEDSVMGGNFILGLPASYDLNDFLWEINDTFSSSNKYSRATNIGGIYIQIDY